MTPLVANAPRLLVSVRNQAEALIAAGAGADIIDFKEPDRGSLGMADPTLVALAARRLRERFSGLTLSMACQETVDWEAGDLPPVETPVDFLKLGLAGLANSTEWKGRWQSVQNQVWKGTAEQAPRWIAVAYVDADLVKAPPVDDVVRAAMASPSAGVLYDTAQKNGRTLLDWLSIEAIRRQVDLLHDAGLLVALAGSLTAAQIPELARCRPDFIAVRSAACQGRRRLGPIDPRAIYELKETLHQHG